MRFPNRIYKLSKHRFGLGNRIIGVNLERNVSASDTPVAPLGLVLLSGSTCTIHLSPLRGFSVHVGGRFARSDLR